MSRWVVIFEDTEGMLAVRQQREPAHLAYLAANKDKILIAGGLRPAPGEKFVGGLWVLEVGGPRRSGHAGRERSVLPARTPKISCVGLG